MNERTVAGLDNDFARVGNDRSMDERLFYNNGDRRS